MVGDLLIGKLKVDALVPAAFARLSVPVTTVAFYVTAAQKTGLKGDTIYLQTNLDIANLKIDLRSYMSCATPKKTRQHLPPPHQFFLSRT